MEALELLRYHFDAIAHDTAQMFPPTLRAHREHLLGSRPHREVALAIIRHAGGEPRWQAAARTGEPKSGQRAAANERHAALASDAAMPLD